MTTRFTTPLRVLSLALCLVLWPGGRDLKAQAIYGGVIGTVTDQSGAAVIGAEVTIKNVDQNVTTATLTNESGNYTQTQLPPGNYVITISKSGFSRFEQRNVTISLGLNVRVDAALKVGSISETVTVSDAPPLLETDRAEVETIIDRSQVSQLPVVNRNFTNLTLLVPGATLNTFQHAPSENPQSSTLVNTNGQEFAGSNYILDGMNNNDAVLGIVMVNPPIDSIGETSIATSNYDAELSQAGGAVVRVETKAGTNQLHGSAFEFMQNNVLQARDPFTQGLVPSGTPAPANRGVPELRYNQFGGSLGGSIVKDKLFYFGDYQGTYRRLGASQTTRVPTAAERTGDLSDLGVPIFNPFSGNPNGTGRLQFRNNVIPSSLISLPAQNLMAALPQPNLTPANPADPNYVTSAVEQFDTQQFDLRVDHYLTDKLRYFGRYSYLGATINAPGPFGLYGGPQFGAWGFNGASDARNQNFVAGGNYSFGPKLLADFRYGYSRYRVNVTSLDGTQALADQVGIPGLNISGHSDTLGLPDLNINGNGGFLMGYRCNCPLDEREFIHDFVTNWTKIVGNHEFKFGGTFEHAGNLRLPSDDHRSGVYDFDPSVTSLAPGTGGLGLASFELGLPDHFRRFGQISTDQEDRQNRMFYFAQDTWRATTKLTLSYGVRWDTWFPDYSLNAGQGGRYDVTDNLVRIPGVGGISMSGNANTQWTNISPRIGIAYALNQKTVIRTGYGRSYFQGTFGWTFNNLAADIYPSIVTQDLRSLTPFTSVFSLKQAPPSIVFPAIPSNGLLPLPNGIGDAYIPADQKLPYVDQWNFTIERELPSDLTLSMGFVGNVGRHLNGGFNLNSAVPGPGPFDPRRPLFAQFGITQGIFDKCDCSSSNYNSLQVRGVKKFSRNYSLLASYTWSKTIDFGEFGTPTDQFNASLDRGLAGFDRASVFTLAHTWVLPFGRGHSVLSNAGTWVNALVGGWQFNGITSIESGLPFSPTLSNNASLNADMSLRPNIVGDPMAGITQSRGQWFNPAAYVVPAQFAFGNAGRNSLRGPDVFEADFSFAKNFALTERLNMQFRAEMYNIFNRTNLALPSTDVDTGTAGLITDIASPMRNMQFGMRFSW